MKLFLSVVLLVSSSLAWAAPAQVLIIRHGEKADSGADLSQAGYQRAQELVDYFEHNPRVTRYGTPAAIYAFAPKPSDHSTHNLESKSLRGVETVTPLANALGLTIQRQFTKDETQDAVDEVMSNPAYDGKMVLLCWEHVMIPQLAHQFGADQAPDKWPGSDVYDQVWEIDFSSNGAVSAFTTFAEAVSPPEN